MANDPVANYVNRYRYAMSQWYTRAYRHYLRLSKVVQLAQIHTHYVIGDTPKFNRAGRDLFALHCDMEAAAGKILEAYSKDDFSGMYTTKICLELLTKEFFESLEVFKTRNLKQLCWDDMIALERSGASWEEIQQHVTRR